MPSDTTSTARPAKFTPGVVLNGYAPSISHFANSIPRRYTITDTLNQGSYGIVVLARDSKTESHVAIKCLAKNTSPDSPDVDTCPFFRAELHFHNLLAEQDDVPGSEHVIRCLDSFETSQHAFLVLEYCDLGDLYENIMQGRIPRDTQTVKEMMIQLVDAIKFCHAAGVYHRDIKPENILMTIMNDGSGRPLLKLGDFGLATHEDWATDIGTGSERYMAPEQFESIHDGGYSPAKADIWALGCCILNVVFSRNPFKVPSTSDPTFADYVRDPMSLMDVFPTMSNDTFDILKHALAIDPAKRDLDKVRQAICALGNWTDSETADDEEEENVQTDFTCYADEPITCTFVTRAPLRTPSLAHNQPFFSDATAFSWASALQSPIGNGITPIEESEDEDDEAFYSELSDNVEELPSTDDTTSSDSGLGTSLGSLSITPMTRKDKPVPTSKYTKTFLPTPPSSATKPTPARPIQTTTLRNKSISEKTTSSSMPISSGRTILSKYLNESTDRLKFGKSWSDWVEEEEEEEERLSRGDSQSSQMSRSSFNEDEWWAGVPTAHAFEDLIKT